MQTKHDTVAMTNVYKQNMAMQASAKGAPNTIFYPFGMVQRGF